MTLKHSGRASVLLLLLLLTGCGGIESGQVTAKDHDEAWVQMVTSCSGKPTVCRTTPIYHPEQWKLRLRAGDEADWKGVSEAEYAEYQVGEWYP